MRKPDYSSANIVSPKPRLTLVTCGYKDIKQTYQEIDHVIMEDLAPPDAFNEGVQSQDNPLFCFLDTSSDFAVDTVVEDVMNLLSDYPEFGGVYTDNIQNGNRQYFPSYFYPLLDKIVINTPFFCRKELNIQFNPQAAMYYHEALKRIGQRTILQHIPQPLFVI